MKYRFKLFGKFVDTKEYEKIAVGIVTLPNTILVINKNYNAIYFPGGTVEENENDIEALKRELKEELNLELIKISKDFIETFVYSPKKKTNILVKTYFGKIKGNIKINNDEIEGVIIYPFYLINEKFLEWLNKRYLLGPSVLDCFLIKKDLLNKIIKENNFIYNDKSL